MKKVEREDILLVDDNLENLKVLTTFLKPVGYKIRIAKEGLQALNSIKQKKPKIILLDIQMPEMDGFEVCKRLKNDNNTADIPIIFISALSAISDKVKAFKLGAVDYIEKPFQIDEVIARVSKHLAFIKQKEELKAALKEISTTQNKLIQSDKMASLGVLSAGIAHEINNPINFVNAGASAIELDLIDLMKLLDFYETINLKKHIPEAANEVENIKSSIDYQYIRKNIIDTIKDVRHGVNRAAEIIKGLKRFSRGDNEEKYEVNIHDEIENNITIIKRLSKKKIEFVRDFEESIQIIQGFPGQLNQLFMNLIMNAEQAIEKKGTIKIVTSNQTNGVHISVSDDGCGIPEEMGDRIFDPFLTTKEIGEGTGLGLSISFGIVKTHHGSIKYSSKLGVGTTFDILLPK